MKSIMTPEEAAELSRLKQEYDVAQVHTKNVLMQYGMKSPEFQAADKASGDLWTRIRELQGKSGSDWRV